MWDLLFKEWKSYTNLHKFDTANEHIAAVTRRPGAKHFANKKYKASLVAQAGVVR